MPRKRFFADLRGIVVLPLCGDACGADCFVAAKRLMRRWPVEIVRPEAVGLDANQESHCQRCVS